MDAPHPEPLLPHGPQPQAADGRQTPTDERTGGETILLLPDLRGERAGAARTTRETAADGGLELVELELALCHQDFVAHGFEGAVRRAAGMAGGTLLFHMRMAGSPDCDWVAAVALEAGGQRSFALVVQPSDGGALRVEDAATSAIPVGRIAPAYAGLMDTLAAAA